MSVMLATLYMSPNISESSNRVHAPLPSNLLVASADGNRIGSARTVHVPSDCRLGQQNVNLKAPYMSSKVSSCSTSKDISGDEIDTQRAFKANPD